MVDESPKDWIVIHCFNTFKDANGNPGEHKIPLSGYDTLMTKAVALEALAEVEAAHPNEDFSIRRLGNLIPFTRE